MVNGLDLKVDKYLAQHGVQYAAVFKGETSNALNSDSTMDTWECLFNHGGVVASFDFYTGTGLRENGKPLAPTAAGVIWSLLMDMESDDRNFEEWAGDFGYDSDSRKALATFFACQANSAKFRTIFNNEQVVKLRDMLSDY